MGTIRPVSLGYSLKNIPVPTKKEYTMKLLSTVEDVVKSMPWKALFTLKGASDETSKKTYSFKSTNCPPQIEELRALEDDMYSMVENVSFRRAPNQLQDKMRRTSWEIIKDCAEIVVSPDKTQNLYRVPVPQYEKLMRDNITKK